MPFQPMIWPVAIGVALVAHFTQTQATPAQAPRAAQPLSQTTGAPAAGKQFAKQTTALPKTTKPLLHKITLGQVKNVHAMGDVYLAGQPTPTDMPLLKKEGIQTVITLRKPSEVPWDEAAACKAQAIHFVEVPFQTPVELTTTVFDEVRKVLLDKKRGPTLFHCGSANRVGAVWYAHRILDGHLSHQAALQEAKIVGLRTMPYLERAQAYVKRVNNKALPAAPLSKPVTPQ